MKILQFGFIDSLNIGDRLIAEEINVQFLSGFEVQQISYLGQTKEQICLDTIEKEQQGMQSKNKVKRKIHTFLGKKPDIAEVEQLIKASNGIVFSGGNLLFDLNRRSRSYKKIEWIIRLAKENNSPILALSVGVGPFKSKNQEKRAVKTLKECDYISVRDKKSADYFKDSEVELMQDPVFVSKKLNDLKRQQTKTNKSEIIIGFSVIDSRLAGESEEEYRAYLLALSKIIRNSEKKDRKIILYSTEIRDYQAVNDLLALLNDLGNVEKIFIRSEEQLYRLYKDLDLIVGTRMHSMIFGVSANIPIIGISWQDKVTEMFRLLNQLDSCFSIHSLEEDRIEITNRINEKIHALSDQKLVLKQQVERFQEKSDLEKERIQELLNSKWKS